jgi:hypothetical protein
VRRDAEVPSEQGKRGLVEGPGLPVERADGGGAIADIDVLRRQTGYSV